MIDEYQDISNQRFILINKYVKKEKASLMCVGDDWQTIFSFASSDITKILNFKNAFYDTKVLKILMTYRNSQELVNVAGNFIMKNKYQIKKNLKSIKHLKDPIRFIYFNNNQDKIFQLKKILDHLLIQNSDSKIAFLTRYKFDIKQIIDNNNFYLKDEQLYYKDKHILFYTIHTSKGLGFDYVFLLNNEKGYYGFPPYRKAKGIFIEESLNLEERRLFYVALTRTKNIVYLVTPTKKASVFAKEIKKILKKK